MRKRLFAVLGALVIGLSLLVVPAAQAGHDPNGTHVTDPAGDLLSVVFSNTRNLYARESAELYNPALDITATSIQTSVENLERFITLSVTLNDTLPVPGADAAGPDGFAPGVTAMDFYFSWATDQNQLGNAMTAAQPTGLVCGDAYTQQKFQDGYIYRIDYNEHNDSGDIGGCRFATQGPWHPVDGWNFSVLMSIDTSAAGKVVYTWNWARYDAIEGINWTRPGIAHDRVECASLNPIVFTCQTPEYGTGPGQVLHNTPSTLNGANYNKDGTIRVGTAWPGGFPANQAVFKVPYLMRDDFTDDDNGKADEMRNNTLMLEGDQITGFVTLLGAAVSVSIPPGGCVAYGALLYEITPIFDENEIVTKDECFSYSAGLTAVADWAPGNPFVNTTGTLPGAAGLWGEVCLGTSCQADWGGLIIGDGLGNPLGSYYPGLASPFCRYPAGLAFGAGSVPGGLTTRTVDDPAGGGEIKLLKMGDNPPLVTQPYDAVPGATNPDGDAQPGVTVNLAPLGGQTPCGHTRDSHSGNRIFVGTNTDFTAI